MSAGELTFNRQAVRPLECLRNGWQLIKDEYWLFLGITVIGIFVGNVAPFGLLAAPMVCGIYLCLLRREAGRPVSFDMLFKGFDYFVQSLIALLIMMVPALVLVAGFYGVFFAGLFALAGTQSSQPQGQTPDTAIIWIFVVLYVVLLVTMLALALLLGALFLFTFPLIVDRGLSGVEATKLSVRSALGNFKGIMGLMLLVWLLAMAGVMACYIGVFFVYPLVFAMNLVAYRQVFPGDGSVLFATPPPDWPTSLEPVSGAEQTGIQRSPERPVSVSKPPAEPGI